MLHLTTFGGGRGVYDEGHFKKAMSDFSKAIEVDPTYAPAYRDRGSNYFVTQFNIIGQKMNFDQAISDFTKAIEINPREASYYITRGEAYARQDQNDSAISDFTKAIELDPQNFFTYNRRAIVFSKLGNKKQACSDSKRACELNPILGCVYYQHLKKAGDCEQKILL
jgi:Flp pilus assembly protein TadD